MPSIPHPSARVKCFHANSMRFSPQATSPSLSAPFVGRAFVGQLPFDGKLVVRPLRPRRYRGDGGAAFFQVPLQGLQSRPYPPHSSLGHLAPYTATKPRIPGGADVSAQGASRPAPPQHRPPAARLDRNPNGAGNLGHGERIGSFLQRLRNLAIESTPASVLHNPPPPSQDHHLSSLQDPDHGRRHHPRRARIVGDLQEVRFDGERRT